MKQTKISKAIALAITGTALTVGAASTASATGLTMYNTYNSGSHNGLAPDGWTRGELNFGSAVTPSPSDPNIDRWEGTVDNGRPFGYVADSHLNWAATIDAGDSVQISNADAQGRYGLDADIDTAKGAWLDTEAVPQGWKHQTDVGLFQSSVTQLVTFTPTTTAVGGANNTYGITIFDQMATNTDFTYSHHGAWNVDNGLLEGEVIGADDPWGTGVGAVSDLGVGGSGGTAGKAYSATVGVGAGNSSLTFLANAGQVYSIYLGGNGGNQWNGQLEGYALDITTSAVPLPGAVWLMGSALLGMVSFGRKKMEAA